MCIMLAFLSLLYRNPPKRRSDAGVSTDSTGGGVNEVVEPSFAWLTVLRRVAWNFSLME